MFVAFRVFVIGLLACTLSACVTSPVRKPAPETPQIEPEIKDAPIARPKPSRPTPKLDRPAPKPEPLISKPMIKPHEFDSGFSKLEQWSSANPTPALLSFQATCRKWARRNHNDWLDPKKHRYGQIKDWQNACQAAAQTQASRVEAIHFFQTYFEPVSVQKEGVAEGLLTGYYVPEISVRRRASAEYSEPILSRPKNKATQALPRKQLNYKSSKVLAYGRPIDVFFMQVQGSGHIRFKDGTVYRAAFDGHNSKKYKSIGKVLIKTGALSKHKASKQSIEKWMAKNGPKATRELINQNPRYVFFKTEYLQGKMGPTGGMGVPLTAMGSLAIDPRHLPYGSLVWMNVNLPKNGKDYKGTPAGLLVSAQDTGGAINGKMRGDLYFGAGARAGELAGVMKQTAKWTLFLPVALALSVSPIS